MSVSSGCWRSRANPLILGCRIRLGWGFRDRDSDQWRLVTPSTVRRTARELSKRPEQLVRIRSRRRQRRMGSPRLASFDISLMPADRAFFFLLLGSTFLLISPDLGWWNAWQMNTLGASGISNLSTAKHWLSVWREILLLKIAGAAGFFVCFFLGSMPLRRLRLWVYLPAALGVALPFLFVSAVSLAMRTGAIRAATEISLPCLELPELPGVLVLACTLACWGWFASPLQYRGFLGAWPCFPFISTRRPFRQAMFPSGGWV